MKFEPISQCIIDKISGEWGSEPEAQIGTRIIRTANFLNDGKIKFENIVFRSIDKKKVDQKKLIPGDLLIEKSGGSPTQPVGRVVYFENPDNEIYLCNNFTTILRPDPKKVFPKYFFYALFFNHLKGKTLRYQNKTTGIINLKLDKYLGSLIPVPSLDDQIRIATLLSRVEALIATRKDNLRLLDEFLKSTFLEMFGDPVRNERGWDTKPLKKIARIERGRFSPRPRNDPKFYDGQYPFIQTGDISRSNGRLSIYSQTLNEFGIKVSKEFKKGTVVIAIVGATIGETAILQIDTYATDSVIGITPISDDIDSIYLEFLLRFWKPVIKANAPEAARANINIETLKPIQIILPTPNLLKLFFSIEKKSESLKNHYQQNLTELENLYGALSQKAFKGELDLSRIPFNQALLGSSE